MNALRVDAGRGWGWIVEGWRLFTKAPGIWIANWYETPNPILMFEYQKLEKSGGTGK